MEGDVQLIRFRAQYPGNLLLHWGVEGGQGYEGGWRLPGDDARPAGTRSYKNRALQTPMQCDRYLPTHTNITTVCSLALGKICGFNRLDSSVLFSIDVEN